MILTFQGGNEFIKLEIDRKNKKLIVTSSKTNYRPVRSPWTGLFDPGKEKEQEKTLGKLNDEGFQEAMIEQMKVFGYTIKNTEG